MIHRLMWCYLQATLPTRSPQQTSLSFDLFSHRVRMSAAEVLDHRVDTEADKRYSSD
jgi:hypothetical protein